MTDEIIQDEDNLKRDAGRTVSRFNSLKHGLLSKEIIIEGENPEVFKSFAESLKDELKPIGAIEEVLVDRIASGIWRLRRALEVERNTMEWNKDYMEIEFGLGSIQSENQAPRKAIRDMLHNETIEKILRYETTIERSTYKALHELERLQAKRNGKDVPLPNILDATIQGLENSSFGKNDNN